MGMPKRWVVPTTMSAPIRRGRDQRQGQQVGATMKAALLRAPFPASARRSSMRPLVAGTG